MYSTLNTLLVVFTRSAKKTCQSYEIHTKLLKPICARCARAIRKLEYALEKVFEDISWAKFTGCWRSRS